MAYNEALADRVREALVDEADVVEKKMFGGLCFMINCKMCVCVSRNELMCRVSLPEYEVAVELPGVRQMIHGGRAMRGFIYIEEELLKRHQEFNRWINAALQYNNEITSVGLPSTPSNQLPTPLFTTRSS